MNAKDAMVEASVSENLVGVPCPCPDCADMGVNEEDVQPTFFDGSHDHCPECSTVFEAECYPYCKPCGIRWD